MFFDSDRPYTELHACDCCGTLSAQQFAYIDRHGDIEQLCERCYLEAIKPIESPALARRDKRVAWGLAVIGGAALLLWLTGCDTMPHKVEYIEVDGNMAEIHTDAPVEMEPVCQEPWAGCAVLALNKIFLRSFYLRNGTRKHEIAHLQKMRHTDWVHHEFLNWKCATVTAAGGGYQVGQVICNRRDGEVVFTDASMTKVVG